MNCQWCGKDLDVDGQPLKQGTKVLCKACNQETLISYGFRDQLSDPSGIVFRDPKYVRPSLGRLFLGIWFVGISVIAFAALFQHKEVLPLLGLIVGLLYVLGSRRAW